MPFALKPPAVRSVRKSRRRFAGFTLLELMIVVAIIGITAALAAPAISRAMAQSRADRANHDLVRMIRFARSQAMAYGRSFLVHMSTANGGRAELWEGTTTACRLEDWTTIRGTGNCAAPGSPSGNCVDYVDATNYGGDFHSISFVTVRGVDLCFQPNGDMLERGSTSSGPFTYSTTGGAEIQLSRLEGGASVDPLRGVIIPISGAPRARR